jgi:hypothetical protein
VKPLIVATTGTLWVAFAFISPAIAQETPEVQVAPAGESRPAAVAVPRQAPPPPPQPAPAMRAPEAPRTDVRAPEAPRAGTVSSEASASGDRPVRRPPSDTGSGRQAGGTTERRPSTPSSDSGSRTRAVPRDQGRDGGTERVTSTTVQPRRAEPAATSEGSGNDGSGDEVRRTRLRRPEGAVSRALPREQVPIPPVSRIYITPGYYSSYYPYGYGYGSFGLGYFYYDPFWWGSWYGSSTSGYYGGGGGYSSSYQPAAETGGLRLRVNPRQAQVFVDGYYVGLVNDYNGIFQRLKLSPGAHRIEIKAEGREPLVFDVHIAPGETITYRGDLPKIK